MKTHWDMKTPDPTTVYTNMEFKNNYLRLSRWCVLFKMASLNSQYTQNNMILSLV